METYGDTVRKKSFFFILAPWCAHNHHITAAAKMASRQLNISSFFFKKPADAVEDAAPAVDGAALKRKIPASEPDAPPEAATGREMRLNALSTLLGGGKHTNSVPLAVRLPQVVWLLALAAHTRHSFLIGAVRRPGCCLNRMRYPHLC